jgi:hypothetical protein
MTSGHEKPSQALRDRIARDLHPVRPLLLPWQRAALVIPAAALVWIAAPTLFGLRGDVAQIGGWLAWGGSFAQFVVAGVLIAAALREAVPAQSVSRAAALVLLGAGACATIVLAFATSALSPESGVRIETFESWKFCWQGAVVMGVPLVLLLVVLIARALPLRPPLAGSLAGMAAGAAVDGGWRLYCGYSNPFHVIASHGGAVLVLTLIGLVAAVVISLRNTRDRRP